MVVQPFQISGFMEEFLPFMSLLFYFVFNSLSQFCIDFFQKSWLKSTCFLHLNFNYIVGKSRL